MPTQFASLDPRHQRLLRTVGVPTRIPASGWLFRRGEASSDLYLLEQGAIECVDRSRHPETVLAVVSEGVFIDEIALLNDSPRRFDARASEAAVLLRWPVRDLRALLRRHPELGMAFYALLGRQVATPEPERIPVVAAPGSAETLDNARTTCEHFKSRFGELEAFLRSSPEGQEGPDAVATLMLDLQAEVARLIASCDDDATEQQMTQLLRRELQPTLVRSALGERAIGRPDGVTASGAVLAHILVNKPLGEGRVGEHIDAWLLKRPTCESYRASQDDVIDLAKQLLQDISPRRILLLTAGTGSLTAGLLQELGDHPTEVFVVDQSQETLAFIDAGMAVHGQHVHLHTRQESLARIAHGRPMADLPQMDLVVVQHMVEYLPDRLASTFLRSLHTITSTQGSLLLVTPTPSPDGPLLDLLLDWPMVRREHAHMTQLLLAAGWSHPHTPEGVFPAVLQAGA